MTVLVDVLVLVAGFTVLVCVMVGWRVTVLVLMTVPSGASHVERRICRALITALHSLAVHQETHRHEGAGGWQAGSRASTA